MLADLSGAFSWSCIAQGVICFTLRAGEGETCGWNKGEECSVAALYPLSTCMAICPKLLNTRPQNVYSLLHRPRQLGGKSSGCPVHPGHLLVGPLTQARARDGWPLGLVYLAWVVG